MEIFPRNIERDVLTHFLGRSHHKQWLTRIFSAACIVILIGALEGIWAGAFGVIWLVVISVLEYLSYHKCRAQSALLNLPNGQASDTILAELFINIAAIGALYSLPAIALSFADQNGKILGLVLSASVLMNIAGQHVLHPRLILFSLPVPALAFVMCLMSLADLGSNTWVMVLIAAVYVLQTALLTLTATRSDRALIEAKSTAVKEAAARNVADSANQAKSDFLANMSHELRTPLNAILGYGEILKESLESAARASDVQDIEKVLVSANRLINLVDEIFDASLIEAGKMTLKKSTFDVAKEIQLAVDMVAPSVPANRNKLNVHLSPDLGTAVSDPLRFSQCILNLLTNALKFTSDGEVVLTATRTFDEGGDLIEVGVQDNGIGIAEGQLETIFQLFSQGDTSSTRKFGGTGLGLSLTGSLAHLMGGWITVSSELGKGSFFNLTIPAELPRSANLDD